MGDAYAAALGALVPVVNDAYKYYDRGDYKDDKLAKAQKLHPQLVAVFSAFDKADSDLSKAVDQMQEELDRRELARLEKGEGRKAHWHTVQTTLLAKALLQESAKDVTKINLGALTAASEAYEKEVDAFDAWATQNKSEAGNVSSYLGSAKRLLVAGKNLVRRLRDKKPYSSTEKSWMGTASGWMVDGSPDRSALQVQRRHQRLQLRPVLNSVPPARAALLKGGATSLKRSRRAPTVCAAGCAAQIGTGSIAIGKN